MTRISLLAVVIAIALAGCGDSVPKVDDPRNIVVDGKAVTPRAFVDKYCADKAEHATCIKVRRAIVADSVYSKSGPTRF